MSKKALLIGIDYLNRTDIQLSGCINDVMNMRAMLIDAYNYVPSDIITLRDDSTLPSLLPTRSNILSYLRSLAGQSNKLSEIWIHYSGHGSQMQDYTNINSSRPGLDDVLIPMDYDTSGIITDLDILAIIRTIKCRCFVLFDSCNSGTISDLPFVFNYQSPTQYTVTQINNLTIANPNIYVFSACRDNQTSSDATDTSGKAFFGAFTNAFLESLRKNMHNVSILNLYRDICTYLINQGFSQIPVLSSSTRNLAASSLLRSTQIVTLGGTNTSTKTPTFGELKQTVKKNMFDIIYV